ncbi:insulinase family protein [bacterium]|nr:MAG: insulinase family protein [bacterium]
MHRSVLAGLSFLAVVFLCAPLAQAQDIAKLEDQVTEFTLDNGLRFIVVERHDAPVFSYFAQVKVGAVNEPMGRTGLAHMFEHMAFKGTDKLGTENWGKERRALEDVDEAYAALAAARHSGASDEEVAAAQAAFEASQDAAREFVVTNEFGSTVEKAGGTALNASTGYDLTTYFYQLPSNKLELWAYLESERFQNPVMREFYTERDVVIEERRMRTDSSPIGRLLEEFLAAAYLGHPYGRPVVGYRSDLDEFTRAEAMELYQTYYVPSNIVIGMAGDVDPEEVREYAEKYFGDWKAGPVPPRVRTIEPEQRGERRVVIRDPGQPFLLMAYHKPAGDHEDSPAYDVLTTLLANGRSSRLHSRLVKDEKKAVAVGAITQIPGEQYPGLVLTFVVPSKGVGAGECEAAVLEEIDAIATNGVDADELAGVKTRMKADFVRQARSNIGMLRGLVGEEVLWGDWRAALAYPFEIDAVTSEDLQRIAQETFVESNRTVGYIITEEEGEDDAS